MNRLEVTLKRPSELTSGEREAWNTFLDSDPALGSPYFTLEFAECCEEARDDTRIALIRRGGELKAFLPMQTGRLGYVRPLAGPLGDVHGLIAEPGCTLVLQDVMQAARIPVFDFHSALCSQSAFADQALHRDGSWIMDVSEGYDCWLARRKSVSPKYVRNIATRQRRLNEADGGHSFIMADDRPEVLETMIGWKRQQYRETGVFDVFSRAWPRRLLQAILKRQSDRFSGLSSSLNINGEIVAVHIGMASDRMCHYWFPAYNRDAGPMSPGLLLLLEMARTAAVIGHQGVELGPGQYGFKSDLANYQVGLAAGYVTTPSVQGAARKASASMLRALDSGNETGPATWPGKAIRKIDRLAGFYGV
jgi:CelD/BcsL family acetyltransferase involved in cellulose biosynthesis